MIPPGGGGMAGGLFAGGMPKLSSTAGSRLGSAGGHSPLSNQPSGGPPPSFNRPSGPPPPPFNRPGLGSPGEHVYSVYCVVSWYNIFTFSLLVLSIGHFFFYDGDW